MTAYERVMNARAKGRFTAVDYIKNNLYIADYANNAIRMLNLNFTHY